MNRESNMNESATYEQLRHRIEQEDELLNARTNIFLVMNGLAAVAVGIDSRSGGRLLVCIITCFINILWLLCALQSRQVLKYVTKDMLRCFPNHPVERIVQDALGDHHWMRPTTILAIYIPGLVTIGWIVAIVIVLT
jgi:hypothetical protein